MQQKCCSTEVNPNRTLSELHCFHVFSCHPGIDFGGSLKLNEHIWCGVSVSKSFFLGCVDQFSWISTIDSKKNFGNERWFWGYPGITGYQTVMYSLLVVFFLKMCCFLVFFVESSSLLDS